MENQVTIQKLPQEVFSALAPKVQAHITLLEKACIAQNRLIADNVRF